MLVYGYGFIIYFANIWFLILFAWRHNQKLMFHMKLIILTGSYFSSEICWSFFWNSEVRSLSELNIEPVFMHDIIWFIYFDSTSIVFMDLEISRFSKVFCIVLYWTYMGWTLLSEGEPVKLSRYFDNVFQTVHTVWTIHVLRFFENDIFQQILPAWNRWTGLGIRFWYLAWFSFLKNS